ncbi:unnamed protein product [Durusdinium trenchii]|uniref:HP domain-containing protein n=1 Tax=Durusdinium trenchii TaxID=1381693 RepID=A0ABP0RZY8_9DINO
MHGANANARRALGGASHAGDFVSQITKGGSGDIRANRGHSGCSDVLYIDDMPRIPASELHGDLCGIRINATLYGSTQLCKEDHEAELCNEFMKTEPLQRLVLAVTSSTLAFLGEAFSILGRLKTSKTHGLAKPRHPFHSGDRPVMGEEAPEQEPSVKLGKYVGRKSDHSCPGDHVTWEILLLPEGACRIECRSELSPSKGGTQAWQVEGTWIEEDDDVVVTITKEDPLGGPKCDRDIELSVDDDVLTFKGAKCQWTSPPPDEFLEAMAALSLKELKAKAIGFGLDPTGCIEREEFLELLRRGRDAGVLKEAVAAPSPTSPASAASGSVSKPEASVPTESPSPSPVASSGKAAEAASTTSAAAEEIPEGCYSLEQLTDKRTWEKLDVVSTERETYLPDGIFQQLFGMSKADFAKMPKWKKENAKKKHGLF